ncbi:MAG: hypothetical protein O6844_06940 [Gammaproteobacteria bacterium]|nr:hypothetical protein [Gammaproteobacteria bacterium]MCZ6912899.1 hypothetical protein [Pseudomonadota bacterium]
MNRFTLVFRSLLVSMAGQAQGTHQSSPAKAAPVDSVGDELAGIVVPGAIQHETSQLPTQ